MRTLLLTLTTCLFVLPVYGKYSGGSGTAGDPYQIATAADLIALGGSPGDYDKHFILTADIDLDPNLPGRKVFDKALIASKPSLVGGTSFTGVFDGNGHRLHNYRGTDALFGYVEGATAEVKNLGLAKPDVAADDASSLLVAYLEDGTISNCDVQDCNFSTRPRHLGAGGGGLVWQNNGTIMNCHISGQVSGGPHVIGGLVASNGENGTITCCSFSGSLLGIKGDGDKGGLVGWNQGGISFCYSTGLVPGGDGLVGHNYYGGVISNCYSRSNVSGGAELVGQNWGIVSNCYSTGTVSGGSFAGGLVRSSYGGVVTGCFWDIQTSGQSTSAGGTGKTTAEMQTAKTFLDAGWDFMWESANGTEDIWGIDEGKGYPRFVWEFLSPQDGAKDVSRVPTLRWVPGGPGLQHDVYLGDDEPAVASATTESPGIYRGRQPAVVANYEPGNLVCGKAYYWRIDEVNQTDPNRVWKGDVWSFTITDFLVSRIPTDGTLDVVQPVVLRWRPVGRCLQHDVYFGGDEADVANATTETLGIYRGRQPAEEPTYDAGALEWGKTYYWRIDGVDGADPNSPWKGDVWSFTTADFILVSVVDDFESYTDDRGHIIFKTWIDRGGSSVGNYPPDGPPYAEQVIVHGGRQSMPMDYDNTVEPWYSEAQRTWEMPQDWSIDGADALTLYFLRGEADNSRDQLYVAIEDSAGYVAVVTHPDPNAVLATRWQKWQITLADLRAAGVDVAAVKKMAIGVGDRNNPQPGGTGKIYIDDIRLTKRMP